MQWCLITAPLSQEQMFYSARLGGGTEHHRLCISHKLFPREQNSAVNGKECSEVKWVFEALRHCLEQSESPVVTDHHPFTWRNQKQEMKICRKISRWCFAVQPTPHRASCFQTMPKHSAAMGGVEGKVDIFSLRISIQV
ncbi:unnamed protein product [Lepidochelys kempii]